MHPPRSTAAPEELFRYIDLKLAAMGQPVNAQSADPYFLELAGPLLRNYHQKDQLLGGRLCPADARIQAFLDAYLPGAGTTSTPRLPASTFVLDRPGLARAMSLPAGEDTFSSPYLKSYRVAQGVLHNPKADRRTTKGSFHIVAGGLPIPADKVGVPAGTFAQLLAAALAPPEDVLTLPFTANQDHRVHLFVSLLLRPIVCPATGRDPEKSMETRFFAPASLVSNLDFVETIFGNAGDPYLPENDAALDIAHWTGHTGCVILAPHLVGLLKKDLGLPHVDAATALERRDGMCWRDDREPLQRRGGFQDHVPRRARRHRDHHRGQLLRLLQEGSEDPDQLRGQSVRSVRRRARRRRARVSGVRPGTGVLCRPHRAHEEGRLRRGDGPAGRPCRSAAGTVRDRPDVSGRLLRAGERGLPRPRRLRALAVWRPDPPTRAAAVGEPTYCPGARKSGSRSSRADRRGG